MFFQAKPTSSREYRAAYAEGRHAGAEGFSAKRNPYPQGDPAWAGWADGHYDARSVKAVARERFSAELWR